MFKLKLMTAALCFVAIQAIADPFMGEGKQGYINRCATDFSRQGVDMQFARAFCSCTADKMELEYPSLMRSLNPSDAPAINQNKMNQHGQRIMQQCLDLAK